MTIKTEPVIVTFGLLDPRSAENAEVIERPFEKGVAAGVSATVPTEIFGLNGFHTLRAAYSDARGIDLDEIGPIRPPSLGSGPVTKKGYWFGSYAIQQNLFQSETIRRSAGACSGSRRNPMQTPHPSDRRHACRPRRQ